MEESMKLHFMINDLRLLLETGVTGDVYIMDGETVTSTHFLLTTPAAIKKYLMSLFVSTSLNLYFYC